MLFVLLKEMLFLPKIYLKKKKVVDLSDLSIGDDYRDLECNTLAAFNSKINIEPVLNGFAGVSLSDPSRLLQAI